jgi:YhcH/YjgK/YiaL family protein
MILDSLVQSQRYERLMPFLASAFDFLRRRAKPQLGEGRHEIDGDTVFALVARYSTRDFEQGQPEAHRLHLDVQYVISGRETVYWTPLSEAASATTVYDPARDIIFFGRNSRGRPFELHAGHFAVFFPEDVHQPNCRLGPSGPVHKVVVKVRL